MRSTSLAVIALLSTVSAHQVRFLEPGFNAANYDVETDLSNHEATISKKD